MKIEKFGALLPEDECMHVSWTAEKQVNRDIRSAILTGLFELPL